MMPSGERSSAEIYVRNSSPPQVFPSQAYGMRGGGERGCPKVESEGSSLNQRMCPERSGSGVGIVTDSPLSSLTRRTSSCPHPTSKLMGSSSPDHVARSAYPSSCLTHLYRPTPPSSRGQTAATNQHPRNCRRWTTTPSAQSGIDPSLIVNAVRGASSRIPWPLRSGGRCQFKTDRTNCSAVAPGSVRHGSWSTLSSQEASPS
jgi:hypothetical protein